MRSTAGSGPPTIESQDRRAAWAAGLLFAAICVAVFVAAAGSLWAANDVALHYALVARISDDWRQPQGYDPSLEELSYYPNTSHRVAALVGKMTGSPLLGMQYVAMFSLLVVWGGLGLIYFSLPRESRWAALAALLVLLLLNHELIELELFGHEIITNYFYPQLGAQAIAIALLALVLWLEKRGMPRAYGYLLLGGAAPIMPNFHLVPGAEVLAVLGLLVLVDALDARPADRRTQSWFGALVSAVALVTTMATPTFRTMVRLSSNEGLLLLKYTTQMAPLAGEAGILLLLSTLMVFVWLKVARRGAGVEAAALKYLGVFGLAVGGLCLVQILALQFGYGSEYACKKYAFAMNTLLLLDPPVLLAGAIMRGRGTESAVPGRKATPFLKAADAAYVSLFVLGLFVAVWPPRYERIGAVGDIVRAERFAHQHREPVPGADSGRFDLAMDMVGGSPSYDLLISIGVLRAPRTGNAEDFAYLGTLSKPGRLGRIFTVTGSDPWDVEACRLISSQDGFVVLDGQCVLGATGITPIQPP